MSGVLLVVGEVILLANDETDRVWSESLLLLHVSVTSNALRLIKVTDNTRYQGSTG
jgi:hypothetical protein